MKLIQCSQAQSEFQVPGIITKFMKVPGDRGSLPGSIWKNFWILAF